MKPAPFRYHSPATTTEALNLIAGLADEATILAGGQSLVPMMNLRLAQPSNLIDLNEIGELQYIRRENGVLALGAMTRDLAAERSPKVAAASPILVEALRNVAYPAIRARGTLGGNIAHADPASELPCVLLAAEATVVLANARGTREVSISDFLTGPYTTVRAPDELVVELRIPVSDARYEAFAEFARKLGDFALALAAVSLEVTAGRCQRARIAVGGAGPVAVRCVRAEGILSGSSLEAAALAEAASVAAEEVEPRDDLHASGRYRQRLVEIQVRRALERSARMAEGPQ